MSRDNNDGKSKIRRRKVTSSDDKVKKHTQEADTKITQKTKSKKSKSKKTRKLSIRKMLGVGVLLGLVVGVALVSALVFSSLIGTEKVDATVINQKTFDKTTLLYANGDELCKVETANKKEPLSSLDNEVVKNALISIEDARFYEHNGVDLKGLARSVIKTLIGQRQGGSTIPMQVSKLLLTSQDRKLARKIKDIYYAYEMSKTMTKEEILLAYLNNMFVGNSFYGIEAAARGYFNKHAEELTLEESAMLVGATNNPSKYSPYIKNKLSGNETKEDLENKLLFFTHTSGDGFDDPGQVELNMIDKIYSWGLIPDYDTYSQLKQGTMVVRKAVLNQDSIERGRTVLIKMKENGHISETEFNNANVNIASVKIEVPKTVQTVVSTVEDYVHEEVVSALIEQGYTSEEANNLYYNGGLKIQTTIDNSMQAQLEAQYNSVSNFPSNSAKDANGILQPQSAMVIIDYHNGQIKSLIGGRNIKGKRTLNRATTPMQPGSAIKPLAVYTPAIDTENMTQSSVFSDTRGGYKFERNQKWNPSTTTAGAGSMSLRKAVAKSSNTIAVKVAESLGNDYDDCVDVMIDYLKNFGITSVVDSKTNAVNDRSFPSLTLGGMAYGISPLEMSAAYGALANGGVYIEPTVFTTVTTYNGELLVKSNPKENRVVDEDVAYVMTDILKSVLTEGTAGAASIGSMPVAGKTGTTNNKYCVWFVGYTPYYVGATYIGDDPGRTDPNGNKIKMNSVAGASTTACRLWSSVMRPIHRNLEVKDFEVPSGIDFYNINPADGGLSSSGSKAAFLKGTAPMRHSTAVEPTTPEEGEGEEGEGTEGGGEGGTNPPEGGENTGEGGGTTTPEGGGTTTPTTPEANQ